MRSTIKWDLRLRKWFVFWWLLGISAFIFLNMIFYPSFRNQSQQMEQAFAQMPKAALALLSDTGDFMSPAGFLSSQLFYLMLPLILGVMAISLGSSLMAREERDGTIELLLSRPVSRGRLAAAKGMAMLLLVGYAGLIASWVTIIMAILVDIDMPLVRIAQAGAAATLLALSFGFVALAVTLIGGAARGASVGVAALVALVGYIVASLAEIVDWLKWPARALPYHYYRPGEILEGTYDWSSLTFIGAVIVASAVLSWAAFRRRDIGA